MHKKALIFDERNKSKTYFLVNDKFDLLAYFTISLHILKLSSHISKTIRKNLDGFRKDIDDLPCYLIGQLGRNENVNKSDISGNTIISAAIDTIKQAQDLIGGRIVLIECANIQNLLCFYQSNDFKILQQSKHLTQLIAKLS